MPVEGQKLDYKSIKFFSGGKPDWDAIALDCVCFSNATGGCLLIGIDDGQTLPPPGQRIPTGLADTVRKRVAELTVNVVVMPQVMTAENGAEYLRVDIQRGVGVASTSDGRYYLRVGDSCRPVTGDDVLRLATERASLPWETLTSQGVSEDQADAHKLQQFLDGIRGSDRVKSSVKEKTPQELMAHYVLTDGGCLTNLGILCIGQQRDRARLGVAPAVQVLQYDENGVRVGKWTWDDYTLSPMELVEAVWEGVAALRESYEVPLGMLRQTVPAFDQAVVRELMVNALVHRPYTQKGDIFLNLHPDRLEVCNPGRLPLGVTPQTVLHESRRRNDHLARVFHDLGYMEREGSGFDTMYDLLLSQGRPGPVVEEGLDSVKVVVQRKVMKPAVIVLLRHLNERYMMTQRERITCGLLALKDGLTAQELTRDLELSSVDALKSWLGRLPEWNVVQTSGRTRGLRYFLRPDLLRGAKLPVRTTLTRIEPHRLEALIVEDLRRYPNSSVGDLRARIGEELSAVRIKRALDQLITNQRVTFTGDKRWRRYRLS